MSEQFVDMLEAVQRPQVARLQAQINALTAERDQWQAVAADLTERLRVEGTALDAATARAAALEGALRWYAEGRNYAIEELYSDDERLRAKGVTYRSYPILEDGGDRARALLAERQGAGEG